jgi:hypothetical protein
LIANRLGFSREADTIMEMPKPSAAHRELERLVGDWTGTEHMYPSPWNPAGGDALARITNRLAVDGFNVVQEYEQETAGIVTFRGHGVFSWDAGQTCYVLHWFDSMGMPPNVFRGNFAGDVLTVSTTWPQGLGRAVFDLSREGHYTFRMEASEDGKQWAPLMEGQYQRAGHASS